MKSTLTRFYQLVQVKDLTHAELRQAMKSLGNDDDWMRFESLITEDDERESRLSRAAIKFAHSALQEEGIKTVAVDQSKRMRWFTETVEYGVGEGYEYVLRKGESMWVVDFGNFHQVYVFNGKTYKVYRSDDSHSYVMIAPIKEGAKYVIGSDGERIQIDKRDAFAAYQMSISSNENLGALTFGRTAYGAWLNGGGILW